VVIIDCPDGSVISHTFEQAMIAINGGKAVYASIYGLSIAPLTYIADDGAYIEFNTIRCEGTEGQYTAIWVDGLVLNADNSFSIKHINLLSSTAVTEEEIDNLSSLLV
jgi:hypothetical protein